MANKRVAEKYSVPRKKWVKKVKKQQKVMSFVGVEKKVMNFKRQKLRSRNFKKVDKTVYTWFFSKRSQANKYQ